MKVILLKDIKGVGKRFEEKEISSGYANNMLFPKKLAIPSTPGNWNVVKQMQKQSEAKRAKEDERIAEKNAKREEKRLALEKFKQQQQ